MNYFLYFSLLFVSLTGLLTLGSQPSMLELSRAVALGLATPK